jgi:hypothetical protein
LYDKENRSARHYNSEHVQRWLTTLAAFLDSENAGNEIISTNLWKISGTWLPRLIHTAVSLPMGICVALLAAEFAGGAGGLVITSLVVALGIRFGLVAGMRLDHKPSRFNVRQLFTREGAWLWIIAAGTGTTGAIAGYLDSGLGAAVSSGIGAALAGVVLAGLSRGIARDVLPWEILNNDFSFGLILGLAPGIAAAFPKGLTGGLAADLHIKTHLTLAGSSALALAIGISSGIALGSRSWLRHVIGITLAAPTGRLPWRCQHMLEWAYLAGLLRVSGIAYQFRHDELRRWLLSTRAMKQNQSN